MNLMDSIRHVLGLPERTHSAARVAVTPSWERELVARKVQEHELRLNAIDTQLFGQEASIKKLLGVEADTAEEEANGS